MSSAKESRREPGLQPRREPGREPRREPGRNRSRAASVRTLRSAVLIGLVLTLGVACTTPPDGDPFYTPPSPLPSGQPGDVIRYRESTFTLNPITRQQEAGIRSWQVLYRTQNANGQAIAVSGTVLVPEAAWTGPGTRPIVSFAVGTRGLGDQCAPSATLSNGTDYEGLNISTVVQRGFAVAVTDYEGLGTPGGHTYMVGQSMGRAMLDIVRAAQRLPATGLSSNAPVGLVGYSQGGGAGGWAAQLAATYAPELKVKGAMIGGVPANLRAVADGVDGTAFVAFALMAALGLDSAYSDLNLDGYLNAKGKDLKVNSGSTCIVSIDGMSTFLSTAFTRIDDYVNTNPLSTPTWQARLNQNKLGATKPAMPVYQYHGLIDEIVPYGQASELRTAWCAAGVNHTWKTEMASEHLTGMLSGFGAGLDWLSDRLDGQPAISNCGFPA